MRELDREIRNINRLKNIRLKAQKSVKLAVLLLGEKVSEDLIEAQARDFMNLDHEQLDASLMRFAATKDLYEELKEAASTCHSEINKMEEQARHTFETFNTDEIEFNDEIPIYVEAIHRLHKTANYLERNAEIDLASRVRKVAEQLTEKVKYHK